MTILYLVRHGETEENALQVLQGYLSGKLTENGRSQVLKVGEWLGNQSVVFDAILSSDLQRTKDTSVILNRSLGLPVYFTSLLLERDWGSVTGCAITSVNVNGMPVDAESLETMYRRAEECLMLMYIEEHFRDKTFIVVSHGLFLRVLQAVLADCYKSEVPRMENAEVRRGVVDVPRRWTVVGEEVSAS